MNKAQQLFIILWLLFAIYAFLDSIYHFLVLNQPSRGLIYLGVSVIAFIMHRLRKKQYSNRA